MNITMVVAQAERLLAQAESLALFTRNKYESDAEQQRLSMLEGIEALATELKWPEGIPK